MAFVNEYVSEENVKKYDLNGLWRKVTYGELPEGFEHTWTWDSERDSFYIPMSTGREEYSNQTTGILYYKGIAWVVRVCVEAGGSRNFSENPFNAIWGLIFIKHPDGEEAPIEALIPVLKDALAAYKTSGVMTRSGLNVVASFTF
jgi:hypothetical protein